jgi:hypothetical protein
MDVPICGLARLKGERSHFEYGLFEKEVISRALAILTNPHSMF